jgi:flagellar biosynthesis protein FliQ
VMFITIAICLPFMGGALGKFATELYGHIAAGGIGAG